MMKSEIYKPDTFLYFAYGTNILTFRIHMHNPSAEFVSIARLDNVRLDFIKYSSFWGGPVSTIVATANAHVWGAIWRLHNDDMENLDRQKGVEENQTYIKYMKVLTPYMGYFTCRTYIMKVNPLPRGDNDPIPLENWPSWTYKEIMIMGAIEHHFPEYYIKQLKRIQDNGEEGALRTVCLLIRYAKDEPCECRVPGRIPRKPLKLDLDLNYQLNFHRFFANWRGAGATIVPAAGCHVWGAVWTLHVKDLPALDKQEGVGEGYYFAKTVDVTTTEGLNAQCRVYQQTKDPPILQAGDTLPEERRPSITYIECIIKGAKECKLPQYYIENLKKIPHNGQQATQKMVDLVNQD